MFIRKITALFSLFLLLFGVGSAFGTEYTSNVQSLVLEDFEMSEEDSSSPKRFWKVVPNVFGRYNNRENGKSLQKIAWVKAWPEAYFGNEGSFFYGTEDSEKQKSKYTDVSGYCLALNVKFNRQGYNYVEVYPVSKKEDDKFVIQPILFKGKVRQFDFWVWGANFDYFMEVVLTDYRGAEHRLNVGSLRHVGWKNFSVNIPNSIPQTVDYIPSVKALSFTKFVIWTNPNEKVSGADIYIDHIKYLSDVYEEIYDGYQLGRPDYVKKVWKDGVNVDVTVDNMP